MGPARRTSEMRITFTGRQVQITPALKKFSQEKIGKLERLIGKIIEANVTLSMERHRHHAEVLIRARSVKLSGDAANNGARSAVHSALEKLEKQARRFKEKRTGRRKRVGKSLLAQKRSFPGGKPEGDQEPKVIPSNTFNKKPITVDEAALQIQESERDFLVFRNAESLLISVIYRRKDGNLGLIEPDY